MNPYPRKYFETSSINQHRIDPVASHATDWTLLSYGLLWTPSYSHHIISITSYHLYHKEYQLIMNGKVGLHDYTLILSVNGVMLQLSVNGVILPSSCLPPSQFPMIQWVTIRNVFSGHFYYRNPDTDMNTPSRTNTSSSNTGFLRFHHHNWVNITGHLQFSMLSPPPSPGNPVPTGFSPQYKLPPPPSLLSSSSAMDSLTFPLLLSYYKQF